MTPSEDWIETAYIQAELSAATTSVKEILRMEKCGCGSCQVQARREYQLWANWGDCKKVRKEKRDSPKTH